MSSDLGSFCTHSKPDSENSGDVASDSDTQDVNFPLEHTGMDTSSVPEGFPSPPSGESSSTGEEDWDESDSEELQNS